MSFGMDLLGPALLKVTGNVATGFEEVQLASSQSAQETEGKEVKNKLVLPPHAEKPGRSCFFPGDDGLPSST